MIILSSYKPNSRTIPYMCRSYFHILSESLFTMIILSFNASETKEFKKVSKKMKKTYSSDAREEEFYENVSFPFIHIF
jgi:hypothetical protein